MTRYNLFREISKLCKLEQTGEHYYQKMIQSGELRNIHHDYDQGYYDVSMYYSTRNEKHVCRVWFGTIDDGDFGSWNEFDSKEKALNLLNKIVDKFKDMVICPSLDELNLEFRNIGVYFCLE